MNEPDFTVALGTPGGGQATYSIEVNGELAEAEGSLEGNDSISGGWQASGEVWGGWDKYQVQGWIAAIDAPDSVQVEIDGEAMDHEEALAYRPDRFGGGGEGGGGGGGGDSSRGHLLAIQGVNGGTDYGLEAGTLKKSEFHGGSINSGDKLQDDRASGRVGGGTDSYEYYGTRSLNLNHPSKARVFLKKSDSDTVEEITEQYRDGGGGGSGGGDDDTSDDTGGSGGSGGSDGRNRSGGSGGGSEAYVIQPGDLQSALYDLREDAGDRPMDERQSGAMLEPNATFDPGSTVHIPRRMVLDASKASIVPSGSYDLFTFDLGSVIERPYVNLRGVDSYDARVFTFDPEHITYGADHDERNAGYVDKDAWKPRSGSPHNKYRFMEHERQNFFGNGSGVKGGHTLGKPRDNSTVFYYHVGDGVGGWQTACLALFKNEHSAREAAYAVDINAQGGFINDVVVSGFYTGFRTGITIRGDATARKNRFRMDLQPQDHLTRSCFLLDNPTAQRNVLEGCTWDPQKASSDMVRVERATGQNVVKSYTGHGNGIRGGPDAGAVEVVEPDGM